MISYRIGRLFEEGVSPWIVRNVQAQNNIVLGHPQTIPVFHQFQNAISTSVLMALAAFGCHEGIIVEQKFIDVIRHFKLRLFDRYVDMGQNIRTRV